VRFDPCCPEGDDQSRVKYQVFPIINTRSERDQDRGRALAVALVLVAGLGGCVAPDSPAQLGSVVQAQFDSIAPRLGNPVVHGSTVGLPADIAVTCAPGPSPWVGFTWSPSETDFYTFSTAGSSFDTILELSNRGIFGCNDDADGTLQSSVTTRLAINQVVVIVIQGHGDAAGDYRLNINHGQGVPVFDMQLWLRADTGVEAPDGRVAWWRDLSGHERNASMLTASRRPFYVPDAVNGLPVVRFTGAESLSLEKVVEPTAFSVFVVGKNTNPSESRSIILGPGGDTPNNQMRWDNGTQALFAGAGNGMPVIGSPIGDTRVLHALSAFYNGSTMTVYRDGRLVSSSNFATTGPWALSSIGSWYSSDFMQGDISEILIYRHALFEAERTSVHTYLRNKYALP
jgi:hypothetical protein